MKKLSLSIVIPTYNDQDTIEAVLTRVNQVIGKITSNYEILVLNDASTDDTPAILKKLEKKLPKLKIFAHQKNQGYGKTMKDLYYKASKDWLFSLPGDDQIDPKEILKLIPSTEAADIILGRRVDRRDILMRHVQSRVYNHLLRFLFGIPTFDVNSVRLMRTQILKEITLKKTSPFVDAEMIIQANRKGYIVIEIPILHKERKTAGATGGSLSRTIIPTIKDIIEFVKEG